MVDSLRSNPLGAVRAVETGSSAPQAAERFEVSASAAIKLMRRVRQTGSPAPGQIGGHRRPPLELHAELISTLVAGRPRITLAELQVALAERGIPSKPCRPSRSCCTGSAYRTKNTVRAAEQDR